MFNNNNNNYGSNGIPEYMAYGGVPVGFPNGVVPENAPNGAIPQWAVGQQNSQSINSEQNNLQMDNKNNNDIYQNYRIGTLSGMYEANHNPATIGKDNAGGPSYGMYQIATTTGTMNKYINYLSVHPEYRKYANTLNMAGGDLAAREKMQSFVNAWINLSKDNDFNESQYNFIIDTHLNPLINSIEEKDILNLNNRHPVVKDALYSISVQHGKAPLIVNNALHNIKEMYGKNSVNIDDAIILKSLYDSRKNYVQSLPESQYLGDGKITKQEKINIINKRYPKELQDALNYLK